MLNQQERIGTTASTVINEIQSDIGDANLRVATLVAQLENFHERFSGETSPVCSDEPCGTPDRMGMAAVHDGLTTLRERLAELEGLTQRLAQIA